ncbi:MAG: nitroreductase family protein [Alphaproteobacteria bacterium]|nr:nitroreductase family protein [Alphaproteobacteria bacterium]
MDERAAIDGSGAGSVISDWRRILDIMATRRSCRDFDGTEIDPEILLEIVRDGTEAPSSCNQQQWHFIIVTDREKMLRARDISGGNHHFAECSALVYLCFQKGWTHGNFSIVQSVAGACYHMMLSAHLRGFSCIWNAGIGDHDQLRDMLELPPIFELQGALAIGRSKPSAPPMKAPRRPFAEIHSLNRFERPGVTCYPARPAEAYPFFAIKNDDNPFAEWNPQAWSWGQIGDFRGYSVWAKSPLAGVYVSRRQGEATEAELSLLGALSAAAQVAEIMPWGGTYSVELRRRLAPGVTLHLAELSPHNLSFIEERLRQEDLPLDRVSLDVFADGTLPYANRSLDAVVLPQTLEHMPAPEAMLDEVGRVLKPGGQAIVSVRNRDSAYGRHWDAVESRAQVPNQGPFQPIEAGRVRGWLAARFRLDAEIGIGRDATHDAAIVEGEGRLGCRLYAARCIRD